MAKSVRVIVSFQRVVVWLVEAALVDPAAAAGQLVGVVVAVAAAAAKLAAAVSSVVKAVQLLVEETPA